MMLATEARGDTQLVPMLGVSERYDSNVLMINKSAVPTAHIEDFVTTMTPQVIARSRGGPVELNSLLGVVGTLYRNNPSLNYVGINSSVGLGLTPLLSRALPLATLTVTGSFQYTPLPPAFLQGNQDTQSQDPTIRGIQAFRTNTTSYSAGETFMYQFTPLVRFQTNYNYSKVHFGSQAVSQTGTGLIDTQSHSVGIGPIVEISRNDAILNTYTLNAIEQGGLGNFRTHTESLGWRRTWSSSFFSQASFGAQYVEERDLILGSERLKQAAQVTPTVNVLASYVSRTELFGDATESLGELSGLKHLAGSIFPGGVPSAGTYSLRVSYSYGVYPLFLGTGGLSKSHTVGLNGTLGLTSSLAGTYGATFARNTAAATNANFSTESYSLTAGLNYLFTPALRGSLNYTYSNAYGIGEQNQNATINLLTYSRQAVIFNLSYAFGGGSQFFQGGSYFGPGMSGGSIGSGLGNR